MRFMVTGKGIKDPRTIRRQLAGKEGEAQSEGPRVLTGPWREGHQQREDGVGRDIKAKGIF